MLVVVQHPITDVRGLIGDQSQRIGAPRWPRPLRVYPRGSHDDCRTDFIRGIGPVRQRLRGNPSPWLNEDYFVDARRSIILTDLSFGTDKSTQVRLQPVFRRFYSDGTVARFELGFSCRGEGLNGPDATVVARVATAALSVSTRLRGAEKDDSLAHSGRTLAEHLLRGTTRKSENGFAPAKWWVTAGPPAVVVELQRTTPVPDGEPATRLWHQWPIVSNQRTSCWTIRDTSSTNRELLRRLRVQLSHLHTELYALEMVLTFCESGKLTINEVEVADFLYRLCGSLLKRERNGLVQPDYLAEVVEAADNYYSDKVAMLRVLSERVESKGLARKLRDTAKVIEVAAQASPQVTLNYFAQGDNVAEKNDNSNSTFGVYATGKSKVHTGNIEQNVGMSSPDLAALLTQLVATVGELRGTVPDSVADQAEDTADGIKTETEKAEPDKGRIARRIASLATLLKGVGTVGSAAVTAVEAVRAMLGM